MALDRGMVVDGGVSPRRTTTAATRPKAIGDDRSGGTAAAAPSKDTSGAATGRDAAPATSKQSDPAPTQTSTAKIEREAKKRPSDGARAIADVGGADGVADAPTQTTRNDSTNKPGARRVAHGTAAAESGRESAAAITPGISSSRIDVGADIDPVANSIGGGSADEPSLLDAVHGFTNMWYDIFTDIQRQLDHAGPDEPVPNSASHRPEPEQPAIEVQRHQEVAIEHWLR